MELVLNLSWFLLALASLAIWLRQRPDAGSAPRRRSAWLRGLVALSYALVLLFPVISLTDDLHGEMAVLEESRSSRKALKGGDDQSDPSNSRNLNAPPATVTHPELFSFHGQPLGWVDCADLRPAGTLLAHSSPDRAPPLPHS